MSEKLPDELLSSFFDGELPPEERTRVDAQLADDAEARRALGDLEKLSGLLRELPAPSAPGEFRAVVMQSIERQMLLGPASEPATQPAKSAASAARRFRWAASAVSVAAAAVMMIAFMIARRDGGVPAKQVADADFDAGVAIAHYVESDGTVQSDFSRRTPAGQTAPDSTVVRNENAGARPMDAPASAPAPPAAQPSADVADLTKPGRAGSMTATSDRSRFQFRSNLGDAEVGEVVEALEHSRGKVAVVRLTVVDRMQSVRGLQTLLARNSISDQALAGEISADRDSKSRDAESKAGDELKPGDHLKPGDDLKNSSQPPVVAPPQALEEFAQSHSSGDELIGVLVEAPADQIAQVLRQMKLNEQQELSLGEPIEVAELSDSSPETLLRAAGDKLSTDKRGDVSSEKKEEAAPLAKQSESAASKDEKDSSEAAFAKKKDSKESVDEGAPADAPAAARVATQRQINVPSRLLKETPTEPREKSLEIVEDSQSRDGERRSAILAARPAPASGKVGGDRKSQRAEVEGVQQNRAPVQVLFVFVHRPQLAVPSKAAAPMKSKVRRDDSGSSKDDGAAS